MKYVIANWKQNKTLNEVLMWGQEFTRYIKDIDLRNVTVVICPPAVFLDKMRDVLQNEGVLLGVQDVSSYEDGAHTGYIGVNQIKDYCKYAIVGHSERHEPRELVIQKAQQCVGYDITPLICFKPFEDYRAVNKSFYVLEDPQNISTDGVYRPKSVEEITNLVSDAKRFFGQDSVIIYGGSVNPNNAQELASVSILHGVLVGNASLNPGGFADIVRKFSL